MPAVLAGSNCTIVATSFNPSVFTQLWMADNQIIARDDFQAGGVFTDIVVQAQAGRFAIVVLPQQLMLIPRTPEDAAQAIAAPPLQAIVQKVPHTPFVAVGLNFVWQTEPLEAAGSTTRTLFAPPSRLSTRFGASDARFGSYLSMDFDGSRLRLDVRPIRDLTAPGKERIQCAFNVQRELAEKTPEQKVASISELVNQWDRLKEHTRELANIAMETGAA